MTITGRGVVARRAGEPAHVEEILIDQPGPGEVLVRVQASGVCHTDLHYKLGSVGNDFPYLLGHEGAGIVEAVGEGVTAPAVGDYVILAWRAPCSNCRFCAIGQPHLCAASLNAEPRMRTADGTTLSPGAGHRHVLHPHRRGRPAGRARTDRMSAGAGLPDRLRGHDRYRRRALHRRRAARQHRRRFRLRRRRRQRHSGRQDCPRFAKIIAVDIAENKLNWAREFGATDLVDARDGDPVAAIKELTGGNGVDFSFEAIGRPETLLQALWARDLAGTCVLIGVPDPTMRLDLPIQQFFGLGGALRVSWYGDCLPSRDFPMLADWYRRGDLDLDRAVTRVITLDETEPAFEAMERGETLRSVIHLPDN